MKLSLRDRIVVTGIGLVSPVGSDLDSFWQAIRAAAPPAHQGRVEFTGQISEFGPVSPPTKKVIRKSLKLMNRETQLGVAAAQKSISGSGILDAAYNPGRVGVVFGAGNVEICQDDFVAGVQACRQDLDGFDPAAWGQLGISHVDPLWLLRVLPNMPACHAAIANDLRGPNNTITHGSVATNMAIYEAVSAILDDDADAMIVGGTGTRLVQNRPETIESQAVPAEGSAAFVLERMDAAIQRDALIYGEILAATSSTMIQGDHTARPSAAVAAAVETAIERSGARADSVACVQSLFIEQRTGDAEAGSSALAVAASLLANFHQQPLQLNQNSKEAKSITANVSATQNGLASCVLIGTVAPRVAA